MAFYAGKVIQHLAMKNPTLVVLTDRNDLDDQLFQTFAGCQDLLRQTPVQAESRTQLQELLQVASGGVIFTTIQKFLPEERGDTYPQLSDRRNIVVIADEAHRSQYEFIKGFAAHMREALPNASFIGFTATPIELTDRNTRAVFGEYIDVYDIHQAIEDEVTVPIQYEPRLAKLELKEEERPRIDPKFEEVTEDQEESARHRLRSRWARLEALVGAEKRVVRRNTSIDWTVRESVRAKLRTLVKRVLRKYGYPPDKQEQATLTVLEQAELSCEQWPEGEMVVEHKKAEEEALPISVILVPLQRARPFVTHLPVFSLAAAAGKFGAGRDISEEGWVQVNGRRLDGKMFVARVVGRSMEPRIPDGSYCIFRANPAGTRQGKIVLVQHRGVGDPETGGQLTVKRYRSEKSHNPDGTWQHTRVVLEPLNFAYQPLVIEDSDGNAVTVVAEFMDIL